MSSELFLFVFVFGLAKCFYFYFIECVKYPLKKIILISYGLALSVSDLLVVWSVDSLADATKIIIGI